MVLSQISLFLVATLPLAWLLSDADTRFDLVGTLSGRKECRVMRTLPEPQNGYLRACVDDELEIAQYAGVPVGVPPTFFHATLRPWDNARLRARDFTMKHRLSVAEYDLVLFEALRQLERNQSSPWWCQAIPWADSSAFSVGLAAGGFHSNLSMPIKDTPFNGKHAVVTRFIPDAAGRYPALHVAIEAAARESGIECTIHSIAHAWSTRAYLLTASIRGMPRLREQCHLLLIWISVGLAAMTVGVGARLLRQTTRGPEHAAGALKAAKKARVPALDIFKGIAMIGVVASHFLWVLTVPGVGAYLAFEHGAFPVLFLPLCWLSQCYRVVAFLFIATGYLSQASLSKQNAGELFSSWGSFVARRITRVYPLCVFALILSAAPNSMNGPQAIMRPDAAFAWAQIFRNTLFAFVFDTADPSPAPLGNMWSIGTSLQFWLLFPGLHRLLLRKSTEPSRANTYLRVGGLCLIWAGTLAARVSDPAPSGLTSTKISFPKDSIFGRLDDFIAGALLHQLGNRVQISRAMAPVVLLLGICHVAWACYIGDLVRLEAVPTWWSAFTNCLWQLGGCCILLVFSKAEDRWFTPIRWLGAVGRASFSLMLWHSVLFVKLLEPVLDHLTAVRTGVAQLLLVSCFSGYLAWISYAHLEQQAPSAEVGKLRRQVAALEKQAAALATAAAGRLDKRKKQ